MTTEFVRKKYVLPAEVCRDVPPKSLRNKGKKYMPKKVINYQFVRLKVPEEYVFALQEKYPGKGLQAAVMLLIKTHVEPVKAEGEMDELCTCAYKKDGSIMVYSKMCPYSDHSSKA